MLSGKIFPLVFLLPIVAVQSVVEKSRNSNYVARQTIEANPSKTTFEDPAVTKLREYIRINTAQPDPNYEPAIDWFREQAKYFGLEFNLIRFTAPDLFAVVLTWQGTNPALKSILINSHMDVVGVNLEKWTHDPFAAYKDAEGNIYGQGSTDMKAATIAELEAIRQLKYQSFKPLRTVHVTIIPDEEIGGVHGMKAFVDSPEFKKLNVGFDLDECDEGKHINGVSKFRVSYGHKSAWQFNITAEGITGHGSSIAPNGTAGQKISSVINRLLNLKAFEIKKLDQLGKTQADITSVNLVRLGGGIGDNVLPPKLWAVFDMRIRILPDNSSWSFTDFEKFLNDTCAEAGPGVSYTFLQKGMFLHETPTDDTNIWWTTIQDTCDEMKWDCIPVILKATTDAGYVRNAGIQVFGLTPRIAKFGKNLGGPHQDNEGVNEKDFLESINGYKALIKNLAMVPENMLS